MAFFSKLSYFQNRVLVIYTYRLHKAALSITAAIESIYTGNKNQSSVLKVLEMTAGSSSYNEEAVEKSFLHKVEQKKKKNNMSDCYFYQI